MIFKVGSQFSRHFQVGIKLHTESTAVAPVAPYLPWSQVRTRPMRSRHVTVMVMWLPCHWHQMLSGAGNVEILDWMVHWTCHVHATLSCMHCEDTSLKIDNKQTQIFLRVVTCTNFFLIRNAQLMLCSETVSEDKNQMLLVLLTAFAVRALEIKESIHATVWQP